MMITSSNSSLKRSGVAHHYLGGLLHTMAISGLPRVRTELDPLLTIPSLAQHPVQTNRQSSRHRHLGDLPSPPHHVRTPFSRACWLVSATNFTRVGEPTLSWNHYAH